MRIFYSEDEFFSYLPVPRNFLGGMKIQGSNIHTSEKNTEPWKNEL